jgi:hypothetical protein
MQRRRKGEKKSGKVDQYKRDSGHEVWDAGVPLFTRILSVKDRTKIKKRKKRLFGLAGQHTDHIKKSPRPNETALEGNFFWEMMTPCSRRGAIPMRGPQGFCHFATIVNHSQSAGEVHVDGKPRYGTDNQNGE